MNDSDVYKSWNMSVRFSCHSHRNLASLQVNQCSGVEGVKHATDNTLHVVLRKQFFGTILKEMFLNKKS